MEDPEVVAAIVAGDPGGIAEAYDRYAVPLYAYCRSLLREPADAADAVQDTFLIATAKLGGLRDPGKLRPWLYAVARNECLRKLRSGDAASALDEAADLPTESADVGSAVEQAELRDLIRSAINGLNPAEPDVIELSLGHELDGDDLASTLGVSRNHAHALLSRARGQLERSLGALVVARTGRSACPALDAMLAGWDGQMTVLMRKRVSRHIEQCEICGERKRRELAPAWFAGALPIAALPIAALLRGFRDQVLRLCADPTPAGLAHRASVTARAGPFGPTGFPRPLRPPGTPGWHQVLRHSHAVVATTATVVAAVRISALLFVGGGSPGHPAAPGPGGSPGPSSAVSTRRAPSPGRGTSPAGGRGLAPTAGASALPGAPGQGTSPGPPGTPGPSGTTGPPVTPGSTASTPGSSPSTVTAAVRGTLTVSLARLVLVEVNGRGIGTFTLTAHGGPVSGYSISAPSVLTVSPASGSLASGASVTITVSTTSLVSLDEQLTINPGGYTVTVVLNISL